MYRGDVTPKDINNSIEKVKGIKTLGFVDNFSTGFKAGINYQVPVNLNLGDLAETKRDCCMISNSSSII